MLNKFALKQYYTLSSKFSSLNSPTARLTVAQRPLATIANAPVEKPASILAEEEYGEVESEYTDTPEYPEDVPSIYDHKSLKRIAHGRKILSQIIKAMPTVEEKIDFVNPYERPWTAAEKRRYREWQRPLKAPRKAYFMPAVQHAYDSMNLYKFVTKTHTMQGLPDFYQSIQVTENQHAAFKQKLLDRLKSELLGRQEFSDATENFVDSLSDIFSMLFSREKPHLQNSQIGTRVRYESFVERGGFGHLYDHIYGNNRRVSCDNVHRIGELAFCFKDTANLQLRADLPLPTFTQPDDPLNMAPIAEFKYSPATYGFQRCPDPLFMSPGFEYGDPCDFGSLMINTMKNLRKVVDEKWRAEPEEFDQCLQSMALSSCFSWANAQAHFKGFTQYTDIHYPFVNQAIFTDGRLWFFAAYQLNTLDLLHTFTDGDVTQPKKSNLCWYEGPVALFESFDKNRSEFVGVNDHVIEKILKFLFNSPAHRPGVVDYAPFVTVVERPDTSDLEKIEENVREQSNIRYSV